MPGDFDLIDLGIIGVFVIGLGMVLKQIRDFINDRRNNHGRSKSLNNNDRLIKRMAERVEHCETLMVLLDKDLHKTAPADVLKTVTQNQMEIGRRFGQMEEKVDVFEKDVTRRLIDLNEKLIHLRSEVVP